MNQGSRTPFLRGASVASLNLAKWLNWAMLLGAVVCLLVGTTLETTLLDNVASKAVPSFIIGMWFGLTSFLGQREITKDLEGKYNTQMRVQKEGYEAKLQSKEESLNGYIRLFHEAQKANEDLRQQLRRIQS